MDKAMTKVDLVNAIAESTEASKAETSRFLNALEEAVKSGLKKYGKISLPGFCTFATRKKAASTARNPRTGASIPVPAKTVVTIKAGSKLKDAVK